MVEVPTVHLIGGECDGYRQKVTMVDRPETFYVPSLNDLDQIKGIRDPATKVAAFKDLGRLAYAFETVLATEKDIEYRYRRCAERDLPKTAPL